MVLQEILEVDADSDHASSQGIDARLYCFLVTGGRASRHFLGRLFDLFWFKLYLCETVFDSDVDMWDLIIFRGEEGNVLLHYEIRHE